MDFVDRSVGRLITLPPALPTFSKTLAPLVARVEGFETGLVEANQKLAAKKDELDRTVAKERVAGAAALREGKPRPKSKEPALRQEVEELEREVADHEQLLREERVEVEQALMAERALLRAAALEQRVEKTAAALKMLAGFERALADLGEAQVVVRFLRVWPDVTKSIRPAPKLVVVRGQQYPPEELLTGLRGTLERIGEEGGEPTREPTPEDARSPNPRRLVSY